MVTPRDWNKCALFWVYKYRERILILNHYLFFYIKNTINNNMKAYSTAEFFSLFWCDIFINFGDNNVKAQSAK